ncbi:MAG: hypothetical protein U1F09_05200 [Steroidobacteraceae bacterium]
MIQIHRPVALGLAALGACLTLTACGSNWGGGNPYVTLGGTVSGLSGGTLGLWANNGQKTLVITANGAFTFPTQIADGSTYTVIVGIQPAGQTCLVTNGTGTANSNVNNISVNCSAYTYTQRPLPAVYSTGKAANYSPYRTPDGPKDETPSDAQILQDLGLLDTAGFNLLRLFGNSPPRNDEVAEKILSLAAAHYPDMKFQLGTSLSGLTSCSDPVNNDNIFYLITKLSKYPNVATISVGNETSFYSKYMPLACLESYIRAIRSQVTQPVTADDDFTFYAGKTSAGGDRVEVKPDTILALIDFASIHMYPISNPDWWDWKQTGVAAGPARAQAMMEASLAAAKGWFNEVANYQYIDASGSKVSVKDSMPIVVGETGWKAVQTNPNSELEYYAAQQVNAKWYYDLLYGNPGQGYSSWQGSAGGPPMIFYFEATDEEWKGFDDGWGLWDAARVPRYALCGTPAGPVCNADLYQGAGYYNPAPPPPFTTITFDSPTVTYTLTGFAGAEDSSVQPDPTDPANNVARVKRSATALEYAGTVVSTGVNLTAGTIPFTATDTKMTVRVYSPAAGITVRLKVEDAADPSPDPKVSGVETDATTTVANGWETLTFDFGNPAAGSLKPAVWSYNRVIIFFNFGKTGAQAGAQTYYFDDVAFVSSGGGGTCGTTAPTCAPITAIPSGSVIIYSDGATVANFNPHPDWGQSPPVAFSEPTIAGNKSLQYVWPGPTGLYEGLEWSSVDVSAKGKLHIDFWTPDVTSVKVSLISPGRENPVTVPLTAGSWNSVDIDLSAYSVPNLAAIIQMKLEPNSAGTLYVDNIYFWGTAASGGGCSGGTFTGGIFAADYMGDLDPAMNKPPMSTACGDIGFYYDARFPATAQYNYGGISNQVVNPGGINNFYYGFGLKPPAITDGYFGAYVNAPSNGTADVTPFTNLRFTLWGPAELFEKSFTPQIQVVMAGPVVAGCGSNSGRSEVQAPLVTAQKIGAASNYVVPLSSFTIKFACSGESTVAEILAKVAQVNFTLVGTNIQYSVPDTSVPPAYANGLNVGPISFN